MRMGVLFSFFLPYVSCSTVDSCLNFFVCVTFTKKSVRGQRRTSGKLLFIYFYNYILVEFRAPMLFKLSSMPFLTSSKSLGSSKFRFWSIAFIKADWTVSDISNCDTCLTSLLFLLVKFIFCKKSETTSVFSFLNLIRNLKPCVEHICWKFISIFVDTFGNTYVQLLTAVQTQFLFKMLDKKWMIMQLFFWATVSRHQVHSLIINKKNPNKKQLFWKKK